MSDLTKMSTEELGQEYARLFLISEFGVDRFNDQVTKTFAENSQMSEIENAYWARSDAESLDSFVECAMQDAKDNGLKVARNG